MRIRASKGVGTVGTLALMTACAFGLPSSAPIEPVVGGKLPTRMYAGGATCTGTPSLLVHAYNDDTFILRQPACTNYEKPFLYLLFGARTVLLLDSGAGGVDVAADVDRVVQAWRSRHGGQPIQLVVAHSHAHADHVAGDSLFERMPNVTVIGRDTAAVREFFGVRRWPEDSATFDLGNRIIDVLPIPGHQPASIALYDRRTQLLLTGDTFYPGRLYVRDTVAFALSVRRLLAFATSRPVRALLGTHIENTDVPGVDYVIGTVDQPREHALALTVAHLRSLDSAITTMRGRFVRTVLPDVTIWP